jgi:hypothetical protein
MLYTIDKKKIEYMPHRKNYDLWRSLLSDQQYIEIMIEMENTLNSILNSNKQVFVSSFIPGSDWKFPYYYIYEACDEDIKNAGFFFGLLMWEAVQKHPETWAFMPYEDPNPAKDIKGKTYFKITL